MVQFSPAYTEMRKPCWACFNSSMVQFRLYINYLFKAVRKFLFQFLNGTIQISIRLVNALDIITFQFLYGTIQTPLLKKLSTYRPRFQFQHDAIQTGLAVKRGRWLSGFNSSTVQFKLEMIKNVTPAVNYFQFFYGTIRTYDEDGVIVAMLRFNSSAVQIQMNC